MNSRIFSRVSVWFLIAANLVPLVGVFLWGWDLYFLMVLYWSESAIVGFFGIIRLIRETGVLSALLVPFFCVHFGLFMLVHFVFITFIFGPPWTRPASMSGVEILSRLLWEQGLWVPVLFLFASHAASFFLDYLRRSQIAPNVPDAAIPEEAAAKLPAPVVKSLKQLSSRSAMELMKAPYNRVVIMHVTIIFGAVLSVIFKSNKAAFVLMILLKIGADLFSHVRFHRLADGSLMLEQKESEKSGAEKNIGEG